MTGYFHSFPTEHDGIEDVSFRIFFSEVVSTTAGALRDHVLSVSGGTVSSVEAVGDEGIVWAVLVTPESTDAVTIEIEAGPDCALPGAICTADGRPLFNRMELDVAGPPPTAGEPTPRPGPKNNPATGPPTIRGEARLGATLRVSLSALDDPDGLSGAVFIYQWLADDAEIQDATDSIYVLDADDVGKTIRVRVSFTDDEGNDETTTSAATAAVAATFPGAPRSLQVQTAGTGELAATWQPPESNGGGAVTGYQVQWKLATGSWDTEADVSSATATGASHTITSLSLDTEYAVRVIAVNGVGDGPPSAERTETARAQTSEQRDSTPNTPATGAPTISGKAQAGETLTADTSGIADENGLDNASFSYQWVSYDGNTDTDIPGATGSTYTLVLADEGKAFRVRVSFTDNAGFEESLTSELYGSEWPYGLTASASDGAVALTWKLPVGWPYSSTFQILRNRPELGETEPLVLVKYLQAPGKAHTDTDVEAGVLYVYRVKGVDPFGFPQEASEPVETRTTESTTVKNRPATGAPTIGGTVQVGETLTTDRSEIADAEGLDNVSFSYQWLADDVEIPGATDSTYVLDADDEGKAIKVRVSFTDDGGNDETLTSAPAATVAQAKTEEGPTEPPPAPLNLKAKANADGSVTVSWDAPDDDSITGYQVLRRQPGEAQYSMVESAMHTGGTETTYTDDGLTEDVLHAYGVRAINAAGSSERSNYDNAVPHRLIPIDFGLGAPTVHLTFDDGPREPYTAQMLDLLEKYGARATFFVIGSSAALHPDIIARMARARHGIGNHTWQHERLTELSRENFDSTVSRTQEQIGAHATRCLRPPYGADRRHHRSMGWVPGIAPDEMDVGLEGPHRPWRRQTRLSFVSSVEWVGRVAA